MELGEREYGIPRPMLRTIRRGCDSDADPWSPRYAPSALGHWPAKESDTKRMKVDGGIPGSGIDEIVKVAEELEAVGYDGGLTAETNHDPFLPLVIAGEHSERLELGTSIAVAFSRNPMTLASIAHDLQVFTKGRFRLGLGSQIKAHIEKRFSMPWSHPAPRMRELILAIRAIWACWNEDEKLDFRGDFYRHTLMTPFFNPGPSPSGPPPIQ